MWRKLYKKVGKTFEGDYKLLTKGKKKLYMLVWKVIGEPKVLNFGETFYEKTKEIYMDMPTDVRRWKSFCIRIKFYKNVGKTFAWECKLLTKGRKVVHVDK